MSIRRNIAANYVGQLYATLVGILLVPMYVGIMGVEAYGLIGFYTMLQGWFMLLDLGLTPTFSRETARYNGGAIGALALRRLLRAFEGLFLVLGFAGALALAAAAAPIAAHWLRVQELGVAEVQRAIVLMAPIVALRWVCGLYRGALTGFERIVWLSGFNIAVATLRFVLVIPFLIHVGATPTHFFAYQLAVALLEVVVLIAKTYRLLPPVDTSGWIAWQWQPIRRVRRFALGAAFTSLIWVLVTQTDKLVLSGLVPLTDYGYFTLAVLVASGIVVLSSPVAGAIMPRLARLDAEHDEAGLVRLYRSATQLVTVVVVPIVLVLALFPAQVLLAWTGQPEMTAGAAPVLTLYAVGNGILALAAFPYYLQVARGELRLHVIGNILFVLLFVPLLLWAVSRLGVIGAGYAWIVANLLPFVVWLPIVHRRYLAGLHVEWLTKDIAAIVVLPALCAASVLQLADWSSARGWLATELLALYAGLTALAAASSSAVRNRLRARARASFA